MNIFGRLILAVYTFSLALISLVVGLILLGAIDYQVASSYASYIIFDPTYSKITFALVSVFFIVSVAFLLSGTSKDNKKKSVEKVSELGNISISLNSIESIVMSAIKQMNGVMDVKVLLESNNDSVKISLKTIVTPEQSIPELSAMIQIRTKEAVERVAGVAVSSIQVIVEDVLQTIKPAVRSRVE